jgi:hypothetical protein
VTETGTGTEIEIEMEVKGERRNPQIAKAKGRKGLC